MTLAPIVLFVYNRLDHTKRTVSALQRNKLAKQSDLIIFSDGSKNENGTEKVNLLRSFLKTISGFKSIKIIERKENYGLAKSIIEGVTQIVNDYGKIIVLEDDLEASQSFLEFMNQSLDLYEKDQDVISITGYTYPIKSLPKTFFLKGADCWSWATWKRGWDLFESDGQKLLNQLKSRKLTNEFDFNGSYIYTYMLESQIKGKNNSWAVRWYAAAFLKNKLTLYPGNAFVFNIGNDSSGTHTGTTSFFDVILSNDEYHAEKIDIIEDKNARRKFETFFRSLKVNLIVQIKNRILRELTRFRTIFKHEK